MVFDGGIDKLAVLKSCSTWSLMMLCKLHSIRNIILLATASFTRLICGTLDQSSAGSTLLKSCNLTIVLLFGPSSFYAATVTSHITTLLQSGDSRAHIYQRERFLYQVSRGHSGYKTTYCRSPSPQNMSSDSSPLHSHMSP